MLRCLVVVYGFEELVRVGLVSLVLEFVAVCFFDCATLQILVVPPSIFVCMYQLYMSILVGATDVRSSGGVELTFDD